MQRPSSRRSRRLVLDVTLSGNKGEWSELYALLMLLASGRLPIANSDLSLTENEYTVVGVSRRYKTGEVAYEIDFDNRAVIVDDGSHKGLLNIAELDAASDSILSKLSSGGGARIEVPEIEDLLSRMRVHHLAASGTLKADLDVLVRDGRTGEVLRLAFSIKSRLGNPSTLLNASGATNFRLALPFSPSQLSTLSRMDGKPSLIVSAVLSMKPDIDSPTPVNPIMRDNLSLVDSQMNMIVGTMLLGYYSGCGSSIPEVVEWVAQRDPLRVGLYSNASHFYAYKVKTMLADFALAMFPAKPWDGTYTANGGYLVVSKDGTITCLPSVHRDVFRDYLFKNTRMETASTTKHHFGRIFIDPDSGHASIDLNLQIRFRHDPH